MHLYKCAADYKGVLTCFFRMICLPFQYFIIPRACKVLTMSYESMAISLLISERRIIELVFVRAFDNGPDPRLEVRLSSMKKSRRDT